MLMDDVTGRDATNTYTRKVGSACTKPGERQAAKGYRKNPNSQCDESKAGDSVRAQLVRKFYEVIQQQENEDQGINTGANRTRRWTTVQNPGYMPKDNVTLHGNSANAAEKASKTAKTVRKLMI